MMPDIESASDCLNELYELEIEMNRIQRCMNEYVAKAKEFDDYQEHKPQIESFYRSL